MIIAETERLIIRKFTLEDASFFKELTNSPHWLKYIGNRNIKSLKDSKNYLKNGSLKSYKEHGFGFYVLQLKNNDAVLVGTCGLIKREKLEHVDLGFALLPEYEGKGYGYESSVAIINLAKKKFNLKKLLAITLPHNSNSIKLLEKLGFSLEKRAKLFEDDEELLLFAKTLSPK